VWLHLVDGTYELVRAHFAPGPSRRDAAGRDVKASVGMIASLLKLLHDPIEDVTHVAVAFDDPVESFRNSMFDGYKTSDALPDTVLSQFALAQAGIRALGVTLWPQDTFEADDAIATAALWGEQHFAQVRILSPDKDFAQLVSDRVVQVDRSRERVYDVEAVRGRLGVDPQQVPLLLAISGDAADGIPGVPGFGAKSAATVANHFRTFEQIPLDCALWQLPLRGRDGLCARFNEHRDAVALYLALTTLRTDVPLQLHVDSVRFAGVPQGPFHQWCDRVDAATLRTRPQRWSA
jgi:5'-3' exonuclease